jgi:hypothetical protein
MMAAIRHHTVWTPFALQNGRWTQKTQKRWERFTLATSM